MQSLGGIIYSQSMQKEGERKGEQRENTEKEEANP